jgi:hypothetical protein
MKTTWILILALCFSLSLFGQNDTTTIKWNKGRILIITDKSDTVVIDKQGETIAKPVKSKKFRSKWAGVEFGLSGFMTESGSFSLPNQWNYLDLNTPKSVNFNLNLFDYNITLIEKRVGIATGIGFGWYRYRFNRPTQLLGNFDTLSFMYDSLIKKSQLNITYLRIPLLLEFHIPVNQSKDKLYIAGGVVGALRIKSHGKYVYFPNNNKRVFKDNNDFHLIPINYSFEFRIGIDDVGIYFNYMPMQLFKKGKGPEIFPYSAGISLAF